MTERLHFHFSLSCIGEGNGNPLQCSFLENPRDGEAWWAAVSGVAQSRTRLKRLSSSSSSGSNFIVASISVKNVPGILIGITLNFYIVLDSMDRRRQWQPTPVLLPGKSHGRRSLVGCSPWGREELDTTEWLHFQFSLSTFLDWRRKSQPTPVFLPGESQGWGSLEGCRLWGCTESDTTEAT